MRKVMAGLFISLDGVAEAPNEWQFDHFDEDMMEALGTQLARQDAVLLGRRTYEEWKDYWPTSNDEPFASYINNVPKYVVSKTLDRVQWGKMDTVQLIRADLAEQIGQLKRQPGSGIGVGGSISLVRSLLMNDLLDELTLMIHPLVVGRGKRLFEEGSPLKRLEVVSSKATRTGVIIAIYRPRQAAQMSPERQASQTVEA